MNQSSDLEHAMKLNCMEPHEEWWLGKLRDGHLRSGHESWTTPICKEALVDDYLMYVQRQFAGKGAGAVHLARFIEKCCPGLSAFSGVVKGKDVDGMSQSGHAIWWEFPALSICRSSFEQHLGSLLIEWPNVTDVKRHNFS